MVSDEMILKAVEILRRAADPTRIILFGSYARGDARDDSDLDFLVVERTLADRHGEMVRLLRALSPLRIPTEVIVVSEPIYQDWHETPGTVIYEAAREGRVLFDVA